MTQSIVSDIKVNLGERIETHNLGPYAPVFNTPENILAKQVQDFVPEQTPLFSGQPSIQLEMDIGTLDRLLEDMSPAAQKFARQRLKLLFDRCSKDVKTGRIPVEAVNRLATFCLEIIPLFERERIVMPTAVELSILFDWYLDMQSRPQQEPGIVLTTVCPDYPYDLIGNKAMFKSGLVGNEIGLVGESIMKTGPRLLHILSKSLDMPFAWIVGYAGFEAKPENLESMKISAREFRYRLETSASKLQQRINVQVGILPDMVDLTNEQFEKIKVGFRKDDFNIQRNGMDALAEAVDARDWAGVFCIANELNAIIIDGASVFMGRKAYKKAGEIIQSRNHTPRFYCVCNYMGFES